MSQIPDIIVVGAGIYGITAAVELRRRGMSVIVLDPGPIPHPLAASTDISKVIRIAYGTDDQYMEMGQAAVQGWLDWNQNLGPLFHQVGVCMLTQKPMKPGGFEYESYQRLLAHGEKPERLDSREIARRFPAWNHHQYSDGFYNPTDGYAESGRVVGRLVALAQQMGVKVFLGQSAKEIEKKENRVTGIRTSEGGRFAAGRVLIAAGAWTPWLLPELKPYIRTTGHPVFHLKPTNPALFQVPDFCVFTADINRTGWYGFPLHPMQQVVKLANHGVGQRLHPENDPRLVTAHDEKKLRNFLAETLPGLVDAELVYTRCCLYCDTLDEHFWIDQHPEITGLAVASGGSGHGFKFAPILGSLIADAVEQKPNPWLARFRWRHLTPKTQGQEAARYHGDFL